jgi:site-specific DNA-methyltransferase (adenine-specific)
MEQFGGVILDPFMGSGTTAIAARALGRHYIGFEISAEYCDIIRQRLEQTKTLFDL